MGRSDRTTKCNECVLHELGCVVCDHVPYDVVCVNFVPKHVKPTTMPVKVRKEIPAGNDPVNSPNHYGGNIECIDYLRDKLTPEEFTGFCMGNVLKYCSRWRKKDGVQDLKKAKVYLEWAIESAAKGDK